MFGGVLIHCREGAHRGPFAAAAWVMAKTGRSKTEVNALLEQLRRLVHIDPALQRCLKFHDENLSTLFLTRGEPARPLPAVLSAEQLLHELHMRPE